MTPAGVGATGLIDRLTPMAPIQELDFLGIPSQDPDRARSFYRDVLGMRPDEHAEYEQWAGNTCFAVWQPERVGMEFIAQRGNPLPCAWRTSTRRARSWSRRA